MSSIRKYQCRGFSHDAVPELATVVLIFSELLSSRKETVETACLANARRFHADVDRLRDGVGGDGTAGVSSAVGMKPGSMVSDLG
jgi:hypothetical protein